MIHADHPLPVTRRCALLEVSRSTAYYRPTGVSTEDLALMRLLDEIHLELPVNRREILTPDRRRILPPLTRGA